MTLEAVRKTYLTPKQAAERYLDIDGNPVASEGALSQWRYLTNRGDGHHGPPFVKVGGRVFYPLDEFDRFMNGIEPGSEQ